MTSQLSALGQLSAMAMTQVANRSIPTAQAMQSRAHRDATDRGLVIRSCDSELVMQPHPQNNHMAVVKVTMKFVHMNDELNPNAHEFVFSALGDADATTGTRVSGRLVALAETRATSRALSLALNLDQDVIENSGSAGAVPVGPGAPQAYGAPQAAQAYNPPQGQPAYSGGGGGWNGIIPFGHNKDKHISDPSVPLKDLQYLATKLTLQDKVTPDQVKRDMCNAEIARRSGGAPQFPVAGAPQQFQPQSFAPQPMPQAPGQVAVGGFQPAPLPVPQGQAAFGAPGMPIPGQQASPEQMQQLMQLAASKGQGVAQLQQTIAVTFGKHDLGQLLPQEVASLMVMLQNT